MEEILLTMGLSALMAVLNDPKYASLKAKMQPQLKEITQALVAAGFAN